MEDKKERMFKGGGYMNDQCYGSRRHSRVGNQDQSRRMGG